MLFKQILDLRRLDLLALLAKALIIVSSSRILLSLLSLIVLLSLLLVLHGNAGWHSPALNFEKRHINKI